MRKLMNFIRGMVVLRVTGLFPERFINLCAQENIDFWAMEWLDEHTARFTTRRRTLGRLEELAERAGCARLFGALPYPIRLSGGVGLCPVRGQRSVPLCAECSGDGE